MNAATSNAEPLCATCKKMKNLLSGFLLLVSVNSFSQIADTLAIKKQLELILDRDQKTRTRGDSSSFVKFIDSSNLVQVEALIAKYGWLGKSFVGEQGNNTIFLVIQHSDLATQEKYFPMLKNSVVNKESRASDLALLEDRILMRQGKKQVYGSQVVRDESSGGWKFSPIEDEKNVNLRRQKIGMQPLDEYAKYFGIVYKLPNQ